MFPYLLFLIIDFKINQRPKLKTCLIHDAIKKIMFKLLVSVTPRRFSHMSISAQIIFINMLAYEMGQNHEKMEVTTSRDIVPFSGYNAKILYIVYKFILDYFDRYCNYIFYFIALIVYSFPLLYRRFHRKLKRKNRVHF